MNPKEKGRAFNKTGHYNKKKKTTSRHTFGLLIVKHSPVIQQIIEVSVL